MLKVLLVDDELIVRRGLKAIVPWDEYGMEVKFEASNGQKAMEILSEHSIDLVITDIRMPILDGIELTRRVREGFAHTKILILTCYNDFEYVKEALDMGASGYLLKTDMEEDSQLDSTLRRIKEEFDQQRAKEKYLEELQRQAEQSQYFVQERWVKSILDGNDISILKMQSKQLGLDWLEKPHLLLLINVEDSCHHVKPFIGEWLVQEMGQKDGLFVSIEEQTLLAIVPFPLEISQQKLVEWESQMTTGFMKFMQNPGNRINLYSAKSLNIEHMALEYNRLLRLKIYHTFYHGFGSYMKSQDESHLVYGSKELEWIDWREFKQAAIIRNWTRIRSILEEVFTVIENIKPSVERVKILAVDMVMALIEGLQSNRHIIESMWGNNKFDYIHHVQQCRTFTELKEWLRSGMDGIEGERSTFVGGYNPFIAKAMEYMSQHFHDDLTLDEVANYVGLSKSYFSTVFKKATGESFIDCLIRIRIEKAKELFRHTNMKIYEVAESVGIQDPKYFTKLFKKLQGVSPNQFKNTMEI